MLARLHKLQIAFMTAFMIFKYLLGERKSSVFAERKLIFEFKQLKSDIMSIFVFNSLYQH